MASESVEILIHADNQASAKLNQVGKDLDGLSKHVKDVGGKTKASVEIVGTLANAFGGSAFGIFAGEMAQITERVSAFSEVSKAGRAGALAFRAGLVLAIGAVTYKVAETVASWWFEIDKAKQKAAEAEKAFSSMSAAFGKARQNSFSQTKEDLGLIRDPVEREAATNEAAARIEKQSKELSNNIANAQAEVARRQSEFNNQFVGDDTDLKIAKDQLENLREMRQGLDDEAKSLRDLVSERAKSIEARKSENAAKDKSDAFLKSLRDEIELLKASKEEQQGIEAARNATPEQQGLAKALIEERDALKAKADEQKKAEQDAENARKKEEDGIKRVEELEKKRLVDLEARRIELEKGREAAQAYRLEQDGLSKATAERIAAAEEAQKRDEEAANKSKSLEADNSPQAAVQGRFLTKGTGGDPAILVAKQQLNAVQQLNRDIKKGLDDLYEVQKKRGFQVRTAVVP